jgi:hypothetical protein
MRHHHPPRLLRLRESGLIPAGNKFRTVLNVRSVAIQRELSDRDKLFDERSKPRKEAYEFLLETEEAYQNGHPSESIKRLEALYDDAVDRVCEAHKHRIVRVERLKTSLALIKKAIRGVKRTLV